MAVDPEGRLFRCGKMFLHALILLTFFLKKEVFSCVSARVSIAGELRTTHGTICFVTQAPATSPRAAPSASWEGGESACSTSTCNRITHPYH